MAQTKSEIRDLLSGAGTEPRYRFGQNFMIDQNLVRLIVDAGAVGPTDTVIEVGPGTGTLTDELLSRGAGVLAVEIDRDLARLLRGRFDGHEKFTLIEGDALAGKHALNADLMTRLVGPDAPKKLVANLPYNIASPLVIELLLAGVGLLVFTVQKEVALRFKAQADSDDYGPLTVMAQLLAKVEVLRTLPPQAFWPAPKIESALVRVTRDDRLGERARPFSTFVHQLFGFRRKTLRKALALTLEAFGSTASSRALLDATFLDGQLRPEVLTPEQLLRLYDAATSSTGSRPAVQAPP